MGIVVSRQEAERSLPMYLEVSNGQHSALFNQAEDLVDHGATVTFAQKPGLGVRVIRRCIEPGDVQVLHVHRHFSPKMYIYEQAD